MTTTKHDTILRGMSDDGAFRVLSACTTQTAREAIARQNAKGDVAKTFAELLTASVLVRELMAPGFRLQAILTAHPTTRARLVADAHPEGITRGLVQMEDGLLAFPFGAGAQLMVMRSLRNGATQQGTIEVPSRGGVQAALMEYLSTSEQVICVIALGARMNGDELVAAGGYVVQLLPESSHEALEKMTTRLQQFTEVDHLLATDRFDPKSLLSELFADTKYAQTAEEPLRFGCTCSEERVMASLSTLGHADIADILARAEMLEIGCDYCGAQYRIAPERLRGLGVSN
jgi:molecular chaperone Hsp33